MPTDELVAIAVTNTKKMPSTACHLSRSRCSEQSFAASAKSARCIIGLTKRPPGSLTRSTIRNGT